MRKVYSKSFPEGLPVDGVYVTLIGEEWWGEGWDDRRWLIGIGMGFDCLFFVVEAFDEQSAIDEFVDSEYGHLVTLSREEDEERPEDWRDYAGNEGTPVNLDEMRFLQKCRIREEGE